MVTTLAGLAGAYGSADGTGSAARFYNPCAVAVDTAGIVYVADSGNNTIRKVSQAGMVTTLAGLAGHSGSADGTGTVAQFGSLYHHPGTGPKSVAVDGMGNIFVADTVNNTIRKVTSAGVVTTVAGLAAQFDNAGNQVAGGAGLTDGTGSAARFFSPRGLAVDSAGNVYVADRGNQTIRKVTPAGVVTTLAGNASIKNESENPAGGYSDGTGSAARFNYPSGVAVDTRGNLYVSDTDNSAIRKVTPEGMVTTLAGLAGNFGSADGMGSDARFNQPTGVAVDSAGNLYVADTGNSTIRKVTPLGAVTTLAGRAGNSGSADGTGSDAQFKFSDEFSDDYYVFAAVAVDGAGNIYVVDSGNHTIRKMTPEGIVTTLAGLAGSFGSADGAGSSARFDLPQGIALDGLGNVYVADTGNRTIRKGFPAPMILNSGFNEGQFGFNLTGPSGRLVVVEASTDLVNWLPIWTNTFAGPLNFIDAQSGVTSNRFYRAHVP